MQRYTRYSEAALKDCAGDLLNLLKTAQPVGWACAACMFINDTGGAQCEVCGGARLQAVQKKYSSAEFSEVAKKWRSTAVERFEGKS